MPKRRSSVESDHYYSEVARKIGVSPQMVQQTEINAIRKLRNMGLPSYRNQLDNALGEVFIRELIKKGEIKE